MKIISFGWVVVWPALLLAQNAPSASADSAPLTVSGKLYFHYEKVYSPFSLLESGFQAAILQWNDDPREWGEGPRGLCVHGGIRHHSQHLHVHSRFNLAR